MKQYLFSIEYFTDYSGNGFINTPLLVYAIDEEEARAKVRAYCKKNDFHMTDIENCTIE